MANNQYIYRKKYGNTDGRRMPRCNVKRTVLFLLVVGFTCFVIHSCRSSDWLTHDPWKLKEKEVKLVVPHRQIPNNQSFHLKPAIKFSHPNILTLNQGNPSLIHQLRFQNSTFICRNRGILTVKSGGRLGNLMGEYATLWALAKRDGFFPVLQHRTYITLTKYFLGTSIPTVSNLNCSLKWNSMNLHVYNKLHKEERNKIAEEGIFIDGYPTSVSLFHRHRNDIIKEFRFKKHYVERAQAELHRLRENRQDVVFVGVHVRRTDYSQFLQGRFQAQLVGETYFTRAMNYFRKKFPSSLFVVASDDMDWCRSHLRPQNNDIVYAGNRNIESPAEDMALLAACNHTIISYGNYGFWSAYLSGGEVILAGNISRMPTELQHSIRSANISHWQFFSGF